MVFVGEPWAVFLSDNPERDINRDAKWCRLVMKEGSGEDIGASRAAWRC
jgi:hypothetical protein